MAELKSTIAAKSDVVEKIDEGSCASKDLTTDEINYKLVQNVLIVWLDQNIDSDNEDCQYRISQLQSVINTIKTFTDAEKCIEFINNIHSEKVLLIISGSLGQGIMPRIHHMSQVDSIVILCRDKTRHEEWAKDWSKIKGIFTEVSSICNVLKQAADECEHNLTPISFMPTDDLSNTKLNQLDCSFMYTQIIKEILLAIKFEPRHIAEFIDHCRKIYTEDPKNIRIVKEFERKYNDKIAILWYTHDYFLYRMLNHALRVMDTDIIIKIAFFMSDLHRQIEQLHHDQFIKSHNDETFTVYHGQGLSKIDFENMSKTVGGLMSFNNFLSTSKNRDTSTGYARKSLSNSDFVGILFIMKIDPFKTTTPFASIKDESVYSHEDEVLFSMHSIFRIQNVQRMEKDQRLFQAELTLTSDNDKDLHVLGGRIREELGTDSKQWYRLGELLLKLGKPENAQQVYDVLLDQATDDIERARIYSCITLTKNGKGEYTQAIEYSQKALEIQQKLLPFNHLHLAVSYSNMGSVYYSMGEYLKALTYYEKTLEIQQQSLSQSHPNLATTYNNIGMVHDRMAEYVLALWSYEKSLEIREQSLPSIHPDLAATHYTTGVTLQSLGEYQQALSSYEKALKIQQQSLPQNHPHLADSYNNIGRLYYSVGNYSKALSSYKKSLKIQEQILSADHPHLANTCNNIGGVHYSVGEYSKALSFYEKALEIQQQLLPQNSLHLATTYNNIGGVHYSVGEYLKALSFYEKSLEIQQQSLPLDHPDLANAYNNIGEVYYSMGEYLKALSYYERSMEIRQKILLENHPDLVISYKNIGGVYYSMGEYSKASSYHQNAFEIRLYLLPKSYCEVVTYFNNSGVASQCLYDYPTALLSYEESLKIQQQMFPANHPHLADSYNNIGGVYCRMREYSKALSSYEKALEIQQQSLSQNHPHLANTYNNIGGVYYRMREYSNALSSYEKALNIQQQSLSSNHAHLATTYNNIGSVYNSIGEHQKALSCYKRCLKIQQRALPQNHPYLADSCNNIARIYRSMDDHLEALSYYEKGTKIRLESDFSYLTSFNSIGSVYGLINEYERISPLIQSQHSGNVTQKSMTSYDAILQGLNSKLENLRNNS